MFKNIISTISRWFPRTKTYWSWMTSSLADLKLNWNTTDYMKANEISLYLNRAIAKRAEKVGEIEFILRKGDTVIDRHPLLDKLYKPNSVHTGSQFWSLAQKYYDLAGAFYIFLDSEQPTPFADRKLKAMHLLRPDYVKASFSQDGTVKEFVYQRPDGGQFKYLPSQIIYHFNPDPMNPLYGESLVRAGAMAVDTELQISQYHSKILRNGGKIEGVFKFKQALTKEQIEQMKAKYKEDYAGSVNAGIPLFLGGDADYMKTGLTPDELSFMEAKKMTLDDICILTGVPKTLLSSFADIKFDNADASMTTFLRDTIKPLLRGITQKLDEVLFPDDLTLDFVDPTPENVDRQISILKAANETNSLTPNEKRRIINDLLGEDIQDVDGGDNLLVPFNLAPLASIGQEPTPTKRKEAQAREMTEHPLRDPFIRERYGKMRVKKSERFENLAKTAMVKYFKGQSNRIITAISDTRTFRRKDLIDEVFVLTTEVKAARDSILPIIRDALLAAGIDAMEFSGSEFDFRLGPAIQAWLNNRADVFSQSINETTFDDLKSAFQASLDAGEARQDLVKRIKDVYAGYETSRAELIARTEIHGAVQEGTMQGYKQAGAPIKIWVTVGDSSVRNSHAALDGEERPIDMPFSNGLDFPGDPSGPAEETINCRCVI